MLSVGIAQGYHLFQNYIGVRTLSIADLLGSFIYRFEF